MSKDIQTSERGIAAAKEIHAVQWHGMTYDEMIESTARIVDRHIDEFSATITRQPDCIKSSP